MSRYTIQLPYVTARGVACLHNEFLPNISSSQTWKCNLGHPCNPLVAKWISKWQQNIGHNFQLYARSPIGWDHLAKPPSYEEQEQTKSEANAGIHPALHDALFWWPPYLWMVYLSLPFVLTFQYFPCTADYKPPFTEQVRWTETFASD